MGARQAMVQSDGFHTTYSYQRRDPWAAWLQGSRLVEGGTDMKGFFNQDGFEVVIWIVIIIFLLSIFFDEGID